MTQTTIEQLMAVPEASIPTFSPDGHRLAFVSDMDGSFQAWALTLDDDATPAPRRITHDIDRVLELRFAPTGPWLAVSHDHQGDERLQITLIDPVNDRRVHLTRGFERCRHLLGEFSPDGASLLFAANRRDSDLFDVYRQPTDGAAAQMIHRQDVVGGVSNLRFSPDGQRVLFVHEPAGSEHYLYELDLETGVTTPLNDPAGGKVRYASLHYAADGRSIVGLTDVGSDTMYAALRDHGTGQWRRLFGNAWDITELALSQDGQRFACIENRGGDHRVFAGEVDGATASELKPPDDLPAMVTSPAWSTDGITLAFARGTPTSGADIVFWRKGDAAAKSLAVHAGQTNGSALDPAAMTMPELVYFPTFDGRDIPAWYYPPAGPTRDVGAGEVRAAPAPAVMFVHGGPEGQYRPKFDPFAQYLTQRGFALLATNVRGSSGYGKHFASLDDKRKRLDSVKDLAAANAWLKQRPEIDGNRIAVSGVSYGGFMVLAALTFHPDLWAAGIDIVGIGNFVTFLENTSGYRRAHREAEYGSLAEDRDFLETVSPLNHIDQVRAPLLVIHGRNDPRVPVTEAEMLTHTLEQRGMPVKLHIFEDEGHGLTRRPNRCTAYAMIAGFLDEHLA